MQVRLEIKYLRLVLDNRWSLHADFESLYPSNSGSWQPNPGLREEEVRCLYTGVVRSMVLYGARPLERNSAQLRKLQRVMTTRAAVLSHHLIWGVHRGFRLGRSCLWWAFRLSLAGPQKCWAFPLSFYDWISRGRRPLTFQAVLIYSRHGCFEKYMSSIDRGPSAECYKCNNSKDTAQYTLEVCTAF